MKKLLIGLVTLAVVGVIIVIVVNEPGSIGTASGTATFKGANDGVLLADIGATSSTNRRIVGHEVLAAFGDGVPQLLENAAYNPGVWATSFESIDDRWNRENGEDYLVIQDVDFGLFSTDQRYAWVTAEQVARSIETRTAVTLNWKASRVSDAQP